MNQEDRFADIQMLRYELKGFDDLSLKQKLYIYHLSEATLAGRDIITDQHGKYNIVLRKLLETIYINYKGNRDDAEFKHFEIYLKRVWFANGIYHHYSGEKFIPEFSVVFFDNAVENVNVYLKDFSKELIDTIKDLIFNKSAQPKLLNQNVQEDLVKTSAVNYYENVTQHEAESFYAKMKADDNKVSFGLNTRLIKENGVIKERPCCIGGIYDKAISQIVKHLENACLYCENDQQKKVVELLVNYYKSGDVHDFDKYSIEWIKEKSGDVDFINGFIEVYSDPLGIKGSWEGLVEYVDHEATRRTKIICENAQWFEDNSPVDKRFKKNNVVGITARVINAAMLGGDEYPASAIGINLPNADWIREEYGSKSITIGNLTEAYNNAAKGNGFYEEFVIDDVTRDLIYKYNNVCDDLHTDLHECIGHGSGKVLDGVNTDVLKAYGNTIEEARADLFALYYMADKKLVELGLLPNEEAYKAQYYTYLMNGMLTQLVRLKEGEQLEEAHMRNRALIARWVYEHSDGNIQLLNLNGKTFLSIASYKKLRHVFGDLLSEIQRIKSEGDYEAARNIVERYGVSVDENIHAEMTKRYFQLNIAPYKGFINPYFTMENNQAGELVNIKVNYDESYVEQMLRYSETYSFL